MKINNKLIGDKSVFIIAEVGANHNGDLGLAKDLILAAKRAGADCVKFQTYTTEEFCLDREKQFTYYSQGKKVVESEFEMFKRLEFSYDEWQSLMSYCDQNEITFLTTIQDPSNLLMMKNLGLQGIKVGSDDFDHLVNLKYYASSGLPLILSKGMSDHAEVDRVIKEIQPISRAGIAILHCVSLYPASPEHLNLSQISSLKQLYPEIIWGFSDHSQSVIVPSLAVMLGAKIIEKHFTLDKNLPGPDHWFSLNEPEFMEMVENIRLAEKSLGSGQICITNEEMNAKKIMRRRIIAKNNLVEGDVLSLDNVVFRRADNGIFAGDWFQIEGKRLLSCKKIGQSINKEDISL